MGGSAWRAAVVEGAVDVPLGPTGEKSRYGAGIYQGEDGSVGHGGEWEGFVTGFWGQPRPHHLPRRRVQQSLRPDRPTHVPDHDLAAILSNLVGARRVYVNANEGDRSEAGRRQSLWCAQAIP